MTEIKTPHDYQTAGRHWVNSQLNQNNHPALVMPAGSGKTFTASLIIKDRLILGKKLLVLCGTEEIFNQWTEELSDNNIEYGYINPEGVIGRNKNVYICMWPSLFNILLILPEKFCKQFNEIITDECHHSSSPTIEAIYDHFSYCNRVGLTATLYRMDNKPLGKYYNVMLEPIGQEEAIKKDYLCEPIIIIPDEYKFHVPTDIENLNISEQRSLIQDKKIIGDVIGLYKEIFDGELALVPCSSHKHALIITEMYRDQGWIVEHIHGKLNKNERRSIIRRARQGRINILTTYDVGKEGLNIKNIMGIIWLRLTESLVTFIQMNTRCARTLKNKKYYVLVDPVGNLLLHGSPAIDRKWSLKTDYIPGQDTQEEPDSRICPSCSVSNSIDNNKCWICGYDFLTGLLDGVPIEKKKRKLPKIIDGELVYLDSIGGGENGIRDSDNSGRGGNSNGAGNINDDTNDNNKTVLTKAQKVDILHRDLVGLKMKNKLRDGVKWL